MTKIVKEIISSNPTVFIIINIIQKRVKNFFVKYINFSEKNLYKKESFEQRFLNSSVYRQNMSFYLYLYEKKTGNEIIKTYFSLQFIY